MLDLKTLQSIVSIRVRPKFRTSPVDGNCAGRGSGPNAGGGTRRFELLQNGEIAFSESAAGLVDNPGVLSANLGR